LPDVPADAQRLMDDHGQAAAGEAFIRAMDCALVHDAAGEAHWLAVAVMVMEMRGRPGGSL
jgi:hypothetical protein